MRVGRALSILGRQAALALAVACGACSSSLSLPFPALPSDAPEFPGSSTSVYTRIARGANTCWFGPRGTLDRTYIWHGRAEPESKGGMAEILVHERFEQNQRGLKAFGVTIAPRGEGAAVSAQNLKMPPETGKQMTADAYRWAKGSVGCKEGETDWAPVAATPVAVPEPKKPVPKKKVGSAQAGGNIAGRQSYKSPVMPLSAWCLPNSRMPARAEAAADEAAEHPFRDQLAR